jgi:hypothetical protein
VFAAAAARRAAASDSEGEEEGDDEGAHEAMVEAIAGGAGVKAAAQRRRPRREVVLTEAYPESEFNLPSAGEMIASLRRVGRAQRQTARAFPASARTGCGAAAAGRRSPCRNGGGASAPPPRVGRGGGTAPHIQPHGEHTGARRPLTRAFTAASTPRCHSQQCHSRPSSAACPSPSLAPLPLLFSHRPRLGAHPGRPHRRAGRVQGQAGRRPQDPGAPGAARRACGRPPARPHPRAAGAQGGL